MTSRLLGFFIFAAMLMTTIPGRATDEASGSLDGKVFLSISEYSMGLGSPGQPAMGHIQLRFKNGIADWQREDLAMRATYKMDATGNIEGRDYQGEVVSGKYDATTGTLVWYGVSYQER